MSPTGCFMIPPYSVAPVSRVRFSSHASKSERSPNVSSGHCVPESALACGLRFQIEGLKMGVRDFVRSTLKVAGSRSGRAVGRRCCGLENRR